MEGIDSPEAAAAGQGMASGLHGAPLVGRGMPFPRSQDGASFQALKPLDLKAEGGMAAAVPLDPSVLHGMLPNGLTYYVRKNAKPKDRAALALAVNVGSVVEREEERGVAHIVEHLAFSATRNYSNHDIVKFLESIGAEFGPCQNAYTSAEETVYELLVPVDKPGLLSTALSVLAEFASEIRASEEDLNKERGAVMEEWRERRNAKGRMMEAHWKLLLEGSRYAERLPIGTEQVIKGVPSSVVRAFYRRWYRPNNMAVIAVGDFGEGEEAVLEMIKEHFGPIRVEEGEEEEDLGDEAGEGRQGVESEKEEEIRKSGSGIGSEVRPGGGGEGSRRVGLVADGESQGASLGKSRGGAAESRDPIYKISHAIANGATGKDSTDRMSSDERDKSDGRDRTSHATAKDGRDRKSVKRMEMPLEPFISHKGPRISAMVERESEGSAVLISCKMPVTPMHTIGDYRDYLVEHMFHQALSQRLYCVSHHQSPPFYSCSSSSEQITRCTRAFSISSTCRMKGSMEALEAMWREIKRVQAHGFSEREIARVRLQYMSEMESLFLERDQSYSDSLRAEYSEHFLKGDPAPGVEYEARLSKALLPEISAAEVSALSMRYSLEQSSIVKILEPRSNATAESIKAVLARVDAEAEGGQLEQWQEEDLPERLIEGEIEMGGVGVERERVFSEIETTELILTNGMRVCFKCTHFLDDEVLISGYAYGGLSEVKEEDYYTCVLAQAIAEEVGVFGHKPAILMEMLAGKRVELAMKAGTYMRVISGSTSPTDLETALQLVYQLFATRPVASEEDMRLILQMTREAIAGQMRDPMSAFSTRVNELNYGKSRFFRAVTPSALKKVDPEKACAFFDECFKDPSNFTLVIVGRVEKETLLPLVLKYLGGIPRPTMPFQFPMTFKREELTPVPVAFPEKTMREEVQRRMLQEQSTTQITFPVKIPPGPTAVEEVARLGFLCKLMETRIMRTLRFKHGHVYSVSVSPFFGHSRPTKDEEFKGDVALAFSSDPNSTGKLTDMSVEEMCLLQAEGPEEADIASVLEIEQRAWESGQHENNFWLDRLLRGYQSRLYSGNLYESYEAQEGVRRRIIADLNRTTSVSALSRLLPKPCRSKYTAVSLVPLAPFWRRVLSLPPKRSPGLTMESKIALAVAGIAVAGAVLWKSRMWSSDRI